MSDPEKKAKEIKEQYEQQWLAIDEVVAVGIGMTDNGTIGVIISVIENPEKVRNKIPAQIKGVPIKIQKTGPFDAQ